MSGHKIPPLRGYFNTVSTMDDCQLDFYHLVADGLAHGRHVHIDGQVGYVFAYLYSVLALWQKRSFESLHDYLTQVSELYSEEPKVHGYCLTWAADCLLATKQFELFLDRTIPKTVTRTQTHRSNLRLNVQHHLGLRADPVDIVTTLKARTSKTIRANEGQYRDALTEVLDEHQAVEGDWFNFLRRERGARDDKYEHELFQGAIIARSPKLSFKLEPFYASPHAVEAIEQLTRLAENRLRERLKIPLVGEGWVSETALFRAVESAFPETQVIHHGQPSWLGRQHLDIWVPNWNLALEYHGKQHFEPVAFFGGQVALEATMKRDKKKAALCIRHGVTLLVVTEEDTHESVLALVRTHAESLKRSLELPRL